jgi:hypothetical protein
MMPCWRAALLQRVLSALPISSNRAACAYRLRSGEQRENT